MGKNQVKKTYMNRRIILVITLFIFVLVCYACRDKKLPVYVVSYTNSKIIVDGNLDEQIWNDVIRFSLKENETGVPVKDSAVMTWGMACHDMENFYLAFICNDPDIWGNYNCRDDYLWKEEVVEVFIDTDDNSDNYIEIEVSPLNTLFDSYIVNPEDIDFQETAKFNLKNIQTAVKIYGTLNNRVDKDLKWTVEISIPFADMLDGKQFKLKNQKEWRINFYRVNRDEGREEGKYSWSPTFGRFHTPSKFGILEFNKK